MFHDSSLVETFCLAVVMAGFAFGLLSLLALRPARKDDGALTETRR